ncbi:hypothetical protein KBB89_00865 [Candidatus Gracilibacteria bacterium]|nr:hypothetical protein [Candidatus Gracilibacteria bacterium]
MTSYKIHSIKDSEKLSFIIEGEDEKSISQKLSSEGQIVLSVEKIETPVENLFSFEGKKSDGSFLEGKISADDIFLAYEMLKKDYKYVITKLYPETVTEKDKQEKIFRELLATFDEAKVKKVVKVSDSSKKLLDKYKKTLSKVVTILQEEKVEGAEIIIPELKKLEQNNNSTLIQQELKDVIKDLAKKRKNKTLFDKIRPLAKEMKVFILPDIYFTILEKISTIVKNVDPLFHPTEVHIQRHSTVENISIETISKEYESIQNNEHIHTFLRKKYRNKLSNIFKDATAKYYIYTLLREKRTILLGKKSLKNTQKIITMLLLTVLFISCLLPVLTIYNTVFLTTNTLIIFLTLSVASLVIQSETV